MDKLNKFNEEYNQIVFNTSLSYEEKDYLIERLCLVYHDVLHNRKEPPSCDM